MAGKELADLLVSGRISELRVDRNGVAWPRREASMLYAFIDEQTGFEETPRFLAASCVAVLQSRYNKKVQEVKMLLHQSKEPSFLEQLDEMLSSLDGLAVIGTACLDPQVLRFGEKDGTFDIPKMARTDNAWADIVLLTVAETL